MSISIGISEAISSQTPIVLPSITAAADCIGKCSGGEVNLSINNDNYNEKPETLVSLTTNTGNIVGSVIIPSDIIGANNDATIDIVYVSNDSNFNSNNNIGSVILDITLKDTSGNTITQLDNSLTICIEETGDTVSNTLKYYFFILN